MWLNCEEEAKFKNVFNVTKLPSLVVLNPHKRLRYIALDGFANKENITKLIEKIQMGEAKFTTIPGGKLPDFTVVRSEL